MTRKEKDLLNWAIRFVEQEIDVYASSYTTTGRIEDIKHCDTLSVIREVRRMQKWLKQAKAAIA